MSQEQGSEQEEEGSSHDGGSTDHSVSQQSESSRDVTPLSPHSTQSPSHRKTNVPGMSVGEKDVFQWKSGEVGAVLIDQLLISRGLGINAG